MFAIVTAAQAARPNGLNAINAITAAYPNVSVVTVPDYAGIKLPEKANLFWTTENYHDFHNGPTANITAHRSTTIRRREYPRCQAGILVGIGAMVADTSSRSLTAVMCPPRRLSPRRA